MRHWNIVTRSECLKDIILIRNKLSPIKMSSPALFWDIICKDENWERLVFFANQLDYFLPWLRPRYPNNFEPSLKSGEANQYALYQCTVPAIKALIGKGGIEKVWLNQNKCVAIHHNISSFALIALQTRLFVAAFQI
jgi:hypothetical protein